MVDFLDKKFGDSTRQTFIHKDGVTKSVIVKVPLRHMPVCWGIPMDELCFSLWVGNFFHLPYMPWDHMSVTYSTYLPDARNTIHKIFVNDLKDDYLVMLDSDVMPPPDFLDRLLKHKLPLVGGWYRKKGGKNDPVVYDQIAADGVLHKWKIREEPGTGLEKVDGAGAGCWLMHRSVAEAIGQTPYSMENGGGEDLNMCSKVRAAGFDIYIDWSIACAHAGVGVT